MKTLGLENGGATISIRAARLAIGGTVAGLGFLVGAGVYRPWMAVGGLGCLGSLIALGLLGALFIAVTCSSSYR